MGKKKVLVVPDSFKGSLSAIEVAEIITDGLSIDKFEIQTLPVSDGGDGALEVLSTFKQFEKKKLKVYNAYGNVIETEYLIDDLGSAFIAISGASGIHNLGETVLDPFIASTYGTGQVIDFVIRSGINEINLFLGGSATIDGGTGMLAALGVLFYDGDEEISSNKTNPLVRYDSVRLGGVTVLLKSIKINLITDVNNVITGEFGAANVFGPQKGAGIEEVEIIENKMIKWIKILEETSHRELMLLPGLGAAGGVGLPLMAFSNANIYDGAEWFINSLNIKKLIDWADVVITGEGSIDEQTLMGKIPGIIASLAGEKGKPVIGVCGNLSGKIKGFDMLFSLIEEFNVTEEYAMVHAKELLEKMVRVIACKI